MVRLIVVIEIFLLGIFLIEIFLLGIVVIEKVLLRIVLKSIWYFQWLKRYTEKLLKMDVFEGKEPNHVLVNEYKPGQGIMVGC